MRPEQKKACWAGHQLGVMEFGMLLCGSVMLGMDVRDPQPTAQGQGFEKWPIKLRKEAG